ncbi:hypothetical protein R1flu_012482 [Riccia fluitans]|uniref:Uncharacterized protein n=1 Tax=Riccia fluitans TaxID=41844 RepID=A0ABD1ZAQ1_9MARC
MLGQVNCESRDVNSKRANALDGETLLLKSVARPRQAISPLPCRTNQSVNHDTNQSKMRLAPPLFSEGEVRGRAIEDKR